MTITTTTAAAFTYTAQDELDRRQINRAAKSKGLAVTRAPDTAEGRRLMSLTKIELKALATAPKAPTKAARKVTPKAAPKVPTTIGADGVERTHTEARKAAYALRAAAYAKNERMSWTVAYAFYGTDFARNMK
jgi:hypothetical protein